ncbi:50S ribosomal protein L3 N(5)-glutamine methyltransferase [Pelistega ratti]|uniref:50S ribosomal protein L3 N(5)-glutamine methyltransferase n=1 Tax=Pelistega ratti TaxID=2652177 RepID=UPI00135B3785|nr:50S ribosomal protein L3 N(5)-glutamine methyltransferase [Pelistega ratti]
MSASLNNYDELKTVRDMIRYAVSAFHQAKLYFGHGSDNAWDEAVYLTLFSLHLPLDHLEPFLDAHLLQIEKQRCLDLIHQRVEKRVPLAYLTGEAWLQGYRFMVTPDVLVPRSPISELISEGLQPWIMDPEAPLNILDLCTGSGNLAILAALQFPHAFVDAADISPKALEVAKQNIHLYKLQHQVHLYESDLFDHIPVKLYDVIICNPPYVNSTSMQELPDEYKNEPQLALAGGEDGMDIIRKILYATPNYLTENGFLLLEIGHEYENFLTAFPSITPTLLETETTDESILLLTREDLLMLD